MTNCVREAIERHHAYAKAAAVAEASGGADLDGCVAEGLGNGLTVAEQGHGLLGGDGGGGGVGEAAVGLGGGGYADHQHQAQDADQQEADDRVGEEEAGAPPASTGAMACTKHATFLSLPRYSGGG